MRRALCFSIVLAAALSVSGAFAAPAAQLPKPSLDGRRAADKLLDASDAQRAEIPQAFRDQTVRRYGLQRAALRKDFVLAHRTTYTNELPPSPIRNQAQTGRCYLFTSANVIEQDYALATGKHETISRSYLNARRLQELSYALLKSAADSPTLNTNLLSEDIIAEGGWFALTERLIQLYGAVPESKMPDFADARSTAVTISLLKQAVAEGQKELSTAATKGDPDTRAIVDRYRAKIDRIVETAFAPRGGFPKDFTVDGKKYTPKTYVTKLLGYKPGAYITLSDRHGARRGWATKSGPLVTFDEYNTSIDDMKEAVARAIDQGRKVYVSAPVGNEGAMYISPAAGNASSPFLAHGEQGFPAGVMSVGAYDYASVGAQPDLDKRTIQATSLHKNNHAMTIVGYDRGPDGKIIKWKVENSWGPDRADHGIQHMYDDFFTKLVTTVTVPKSALDPAKRARIEQERATAGNSLPKVD